MRSNNTGNNFCLFEVRDFTRRKLYKNLSGFTQQKLISILVQFEKYANFFIPDVLKKYLNESYGDFKPKNSWWD